MSFDLDAFLAELRQLVECESPTSDQAALERSAIQFSTIGERLLGEPPEIITAEGYPHLLWRFGSGPRRVVLIGHHDTVWPAGTLEHFPYSEHDGIIRGPGTDDMKGGALIAIHALARLRERRGDLDGVSLLITADEEFGSITSRPIIEEESRGAAAALVFESGGPQGAVKIARKGVAIYELEVRGRASHAGVEPEKGINATAEVAHQVLAVAQLGDAKAGTSVVPTAMTSGTTTNTVPAEARVSIDSRAKSAAEQRRVDAALRALTPVHRGAKLVLHGGINRPPMETSMSLGLYARAQRIASRLGHPPLRSIGVGGGSDGNFTAGIGVPTLDGLGTVGGGSHAENEHAIAQWIRPRVELVCDLVGQLLSEPPPESAAEAPRSAAAGASRDAAGPGASPSPGTGEGVGGPYGGAGAFGGAGTAVDLDD
ncbi:M20/M25/M40 family metallo-hydrolase [Brevibacterium sp. 5221]|uniref:M20/M25/M40 family metallo-hydrolase n=1 Tax=Brevibacterium rongguiense TaxID=2695267 RepID=A0A6N9H858_9MICO|nr:MULTISPECIES: M20 family metallopeptidase [Brevibacterium]MYM20200.1 M20/M25/M40 family metallo-hydrolase [Brevibacterium rongguiense]WAL39157.1 M20 family metallopeptidase [Brevibacterium sp. BRM-1]